MLDNLSSHKRVEAREAIKAVGASMLFLPPYSPDLNPIEQAFSQLKTLLSPQAERTKQGLWNFCGQVLERFGSGKFVNYIRPCGYRYSYMNFALEDLVLDHTTNRAP